MYKSHIYVQLSYKQQTIVCKQFDRNYLRNLYAYLFLFIYFIIRRMTTTRIMNDETVLFNSQVIEIIKKDVTIIETFIYTYYYFITYNNPAI